MRHLYYWITTLLSPFIVIWLFWRKRNGKELSLANRRGIASINRPSGPIVWIHAASVGESLAALTLIERVSNRYPTHSFLLTTTTVGAYHVLRDKMPPYVMHQFCPMDVPHWVRRFLTYWHPCAFILIESEIWPNMILSTHKLAIASYFLNISMSLKSYKRWRYGAPFLRQIMKSFQCCFAHSEKTRLYFDALGCTVQVMPNLKFFASPLPCDEPLKTQVQNQIGGRPFWIAASTHPGEESIFFDVFLRLQQEVPDLILILAPRHPKRCTEISKNAIERGLSTTLRSELNTTPISDILIWDTLGEMGTVYSLHGLVVIGGSFVAGIGGHNPIEAAILENSVLFGPHMDNFTEIISFFKPEACQVFTSDDLVLRLQSALSTPDIVQEKGRRLRGLIENNQTSLNSVLSDLVL